MELTTVWFVLIALLWIGYFALEGFDFGVGMLLPVLSRNESERRVMYNTIGPVWDGNEVWLLVAGGATFAAFPDWYATLFSGFYLPLLAIVLSLVVRGLAFEYRHQRPGAGWRRGWDIALGVGSWLPSLGWGLAFANLLRGVPIGADGVLVGSEALPGLLNPFALLGAVVFAGLFLTHGAMFVALKTVGDLRGRSRDLAWRLGAATCVVAVGWWAWAQASSGTVGSGVAFGIAVAALVLAIPLARAGREVRAFAATFAAIAAGVAGIFLALFPTVMPSSIDVAFSLTTTSAAASPYSLTVLTWAAAALLPLVIGYQAWSYWVFRRRIGTHHIPQAHG